MNKQRKSWVWQYAERKDEKAYCNFCNNEFSCRGGTTGSLLRHLKKMHSVDGSNCILSGETKHNISLINDVKNEPSSNLETSELSLIESTNNNSSDISSIEPSVSEIVDVTDVRCSKKRRRITCNTPDSQSPECIPNQMENIHQSLAKMIAMNQLPLSFCSSEGFKQFMASVEPNYKICSEQCINKSLHSLKENVKTAIIKELNAAPAVACTSDVTSLCQESYISVTAHLIDSQWKKKSFTLSTKEMEVRHTASNLAYSISEIFHEWKIDTKVIAVVTDNASNIVNAIKSFESVSEASDLTCAAHTIQIVVNKALTTDDRIEHVIEKGSKIVSHVMLQNCKTRWNSVFFMLEKLLKQRNAITNVLFDRSTTPSDIAQKLEMSEREWETIEKVIKLLKPLEIATTLLSSENTSVSMVRPVICKILKNHYQTISENDTLTAAFKKSVTNELKTHFNISENSTINNVTPTQIASLLDPRFKDLMHESAEDRRNIRDCLKQKITAASSNADGESSNRSSALEFIFQEDARRKNDPSLQFEDYLADPQIRFDMDPYEWWKSREKIYPDISMLANNYLAIPATSTSSERRFSTAGNIVTAKRSCLLPENVDMLVFLYQNRFILS